MKVPLFLFYDIVCITMAESNMKFGPFWLQLPLDVLPYVLAMACLCSTYVHKSVFFICCNATAVYVIFYVILNSRRKYGLIEKSVKRWNFEEIWSKDVVCSKIIDGDLQEMRLATMVTPPSEYFQDFDHFLDVSKECENFVKQRGYITNHLTAEERDFPVAFSIVVYRDLLQVERLLRAIYRPQNFYCIHVDVKTSATFLAGIQSIASCFDNVFLSSNSVSVQWGSFEVVEAELICMKDLLKYKWKYFINLTGQEFPLKTNLQLVRILNGYDGSNDIRGSIRNRNLHRTKSREPAPLGLVLTKGQVHIAAVRGFVEFLFSDKRVAYFLEWLNGTYVPDETFFSVLNYNPHLGIPGSFKGTLEEMETTKTLTRYKLWFRVPCHGKWQRGICVFGIGDLPFMVKAPQLFANKFDQNYDHIAYDCLEEWHRNQTRDEYLRGNHQ